MTKNPIREAADKARKRMAAVVEVSPGRKLQDALQRKERNAVTKGDGPYSFRDAAENTAKRLEREAAQADIEIAAAELVSKYPGLSPEAIEAEVARELEA